MSDYINRESVRKILENVQLISNGEFSGYCTEDVNIDTIPSLPDINNQDIWNPQNPTYRSLRMDLPVIFFFDGKKITRNHARYNMLSRNTGQRNSIPRLFANSAHIVAAELNLDCHIYAAIDEISMIFQRPDELVKAINSDDRADYALSMILQMLLSKIHREYPEIFLQGTLFSIYNGDIKKYLEERKEVCRKVAIGYYVKEYFSKEHYRYLDTDGMLELLKSDGLYDELVNDTELYNGIEIEHKKQSPLDIFSLL